MEYLPELVIMKILKYLEYKDLVSVGYVCSRFNRFSLEENLWKHYCQVVWLFNYSDNKNVKSWREEFIYFHKRFAKYIDCYKTIKSLWNALEDYLSRCCPEVYSTLNPGVDEYDLIEFENRQHVTIPSDYKVSFMIHNGQRSNLPLEYGICGGLFLPLENYCSSGLCPFEVAIKSFSYQCHYSLPVTITQSLKLAVSQLVLPKDSSNKLISHNTEIIAYREGQYCSISSSFLNWFSEYIEKLTGGHYLISDGNILLYDKDTEVCETTNYITVKVRWSYNLSASNLYAYHIVMSMAKDAPPSESCKLQTRHWLIEDADGTRKFVHGEGVVGTCPIMKPGRTFSWRSYTVFQSHEGGSMMGYFKMRNLSDPNLCIDIVCPKFSMKKPIVPPPAWTESRQYPLWPLI